jgi:hypothetical protein
MDCTHFVKARKDGAKSFFFLGSGGSLTRLRVHAVPFTHEGAQNAVAVLAADNPGWEFRTQPISAKRPSHA